MIQNSVEEQIPLAENKLTRKDFLSLTGKSLAVGGVMAAGLSPNEVTAQTKKKALSPPARVPASPQQPIVLEEWKSGADPKSAPTPTPLPENQRVGYAVVGLGHLSLEEILPALNTCKKSKLAALVSGSTEKMKKVAEQYGVKPESCYTYETYDKLKDNPEVDVIYIVLPNALHKEYVLRGAKAGKHILCEKPMAISAAECREMIDACNKANVKLMVAYRIHYQAHNRYIREQLQKKEFGAAKYVDAYNSQSSANPEHWRHKLALAGGGSLPDIGLYCLNTTRFLLEEEPTEVFAYKYSTPGNPLFSEVEELISWQMKFPSGIIANCSSDYNVHDSRRYRVMCERGWYDLENAYAYEGQELQTSRADGKLKRKETIVIPASDQFAAEMDHFSDCVINNKRPYSTGEDGLQDHRIMEAIYQSAKEGKPIKLTNNPDPKTLQGPEPDLS